MKRLLAALVVASVLFGLSPSVVSARQSAAKVRPDAVRGNYVEGEVLVKFKERSVNLKSGTGGRKSLQFAQSRNLDKKDDIVAGNISVLTSRKDAKGRKESVESMVARLRNDPSVEFAQPNFQYYTQEIATDDTWRGELWGLDNVGQTVNGTAGIEDADINAPEAWAIDEGTNADVIVAVIDSGVAYGHPDLSASMWNGMLCLDDAGAPLGDCNHGYDFEDEDLTPLPTTSAHGTHVAGTIAAAKNNAEGIVGVAPNAKIMALKSSLTTAEIVRAIDFAEYNGATVINASWGGSADSCDGAYDETLHGSIRDFSGLFVVAAGNEASEHDGSTYVDLPADYGHATECWEGLDNVISVAATDSDDRLASFSDFGSGYVDVGAPGTDVYSTVVNDAGTNAMLETFTGVTVPGIPDGWVPGGEGNDWGTFDATESLGAEWGNVLFGDLAFPYAETADTTVESPSFDLTGGAAWMIFWAVCDTEWSAVEWTDYMALEFSADGGATFEEYLKWDEALFDENEDTDGSTTAYLAIDVPEEYLDEGFVFRLRWVANGNEDVGGGNGCLVDDLQVISFPDMDGSDGLYAHYNGTSMAAPHVAGLASLIEGYAPDLTVAEIKDLILTTGDPIQSLDGLTTTGKRINAFNALHSLGASARVAEDKGALTDDLIIGDNPDLANVTVALTNPLPSYGSIGNSEIVWSSSDAEVVSDDGQTVVRPAYEDGNADVMMTATITNGLASDTKDFELTVLALPSSEKAIESFDFDGEGAEGAVDEGAKTVEIEVPNGTDVTELVPTIAFTGASVSPDSGVAQDFTDPVTYTVTAADASTQEYVVTVTVAARRRSGGGGGGGGSSSSATVATPVVDPSSAPEDASEDEGDAADSVEPVVETPVVVSPSPSLIASYGITVDAEGRYVSPATSILGLSPFTQEAEPVSTVQPGWLIRSTGSDAVYYVGNDGKRHVFWNAQTYFTWSDSWSDVIWVTDATMPTLVLGSPMLPKPGTVLIKIQSDPSVYKVDADGATGSFVLRHIVSESIATTIYGTSWSDAVIDVEPTLFTHYTMGSDVLAAESVDLAALKTRIRIASVTR